jgi:hypothetical protein
MMGRDVKTADPASFQPDETVGTVQPDSSGQPERAGFGLEYDYRETYMESESLEVAAQGIVKTADGREIQIAVSLSMSRQYIEENSLSLRLGDARLTDPLVLNFNGTAAQLSDATFEFDLDADGRAEDIHLFEPGSAFLALDRNGNGTIDDGSELFGPTTGDGLAELAAYDKDANGWIDGADPIFSQLKLWTADTEGTGSLSSLAAAGVGAIATVAVDSPFELRTSSQALAGQVRSTGLYLTEAGGAGTVQQVDLAV